MKELLSRGIGVHHSGLLPIMKEVIFLFFIYSFIHTIIIKYY